jgi:hypothetical protein
MPDARFELNASFRDISCRRFRDDAVFQIAAEPPHRHISA